MNYRDPELRERLAAEYALGTLRGAARQRFERLMQADVALRQLVDGWELRLNALADNARAVAPPAGLWSAIERRLGPETAAAPRGLFAALFGGARVRLPSLAEAGLWNFVGFWRTAGLAAMAAAIALVVYMLNVPTQPPGPSHIAVLSDTSQKPVLVASLAADSRTLIVRRLAPPTPDPAHAQELWLLPPGGAAPRSLGLLAGQETSFAVSPENTATLVSGTLAVSLEPPGGSPTGAPTGPVLSSGPVLPAI
jgi:anti-sigma-K factor RskA